MYKALEDELKSFFPFFEREGVFYIHFLRKWLLIVLVNSMGRLQAANGNRAENMYSPIMKEELFYQLFYVDLKI